MCEFLFCFMANQHFLVTNQTAAKCWDRDKVQLFLPCISKTQSKLLRRSRRPQTVRRIKPRPSERWPGQHKIEKVDTSNKKTKETSWDKTGDKLEHPSTKTRWKKGWETRLETSWETSPEGRTQHPRPARGQDEAGRQDLVVSSCRNVAFDFWSELLDSWITSACLSLGRCMSRPHSGHHVWNHSLILCANSGAKFTLQAAPCSHAAAFSSIIY